MKKKRTTGHLLEMNNVKAWSACEYVSIDAMVEMPIVKVSNILVNNVEYVLLHQKSFLSPYCLIQSGYPYNERTMLYGADYVFSPDGIVIKDKHGDALSVWPKIKDIVNVNQVMEL